MKLIHWIASVVSLAAAVLVSPTRADVQRHCEDRPLDAAERAAAERVVSAFRSALPVAPAGWSVVEDGDQVSGIACDTPGKTWVPGAKLVPQPVFFSVHRKYFRSSPRPRATAPEAAPTPAEPAVAVDEARIQELRAQLDELERSRKDAQLQYMQARRAGDSAAQGAARRRDQEIAVAMRPVREELSNLRDAERKARAAKLEAHTAAAVAADRAAEERRTDASVSIVANLAWLQLHEAEPLDLAGAEVAVRHREGIALFLGPWRCGRGEAVAGATLDASAPRMRVQAIAVEINGNTATAEALRGTVGVEGLRRLLAPRAPGGSGAVGG
jgi:hypothetical protein